MFRGQHIVNGLLGFVLFAAGVTFVVSGQPEVALIAFPAFLVVALVLGCTLVMPVGGGDMPVVIAMLNSLAGLAACAAGFVIANNVLVVAGCLVGTSGLILTVIMCKAMNRTFTHVLFSGFGAVPATTAVTAGGVAAVTGELKPISPADTFAVLEAARQAVVIPGYGMAVSQAQHIVRELSELLEANVSYEQLVEMDAINPMMAQMDVAIVIGANDVVNPAAANDRASPIYGMPIINAHEARTVVCLKRGKGTGFSGLENTLLTPQCAHVVRRCEGDAPGGIGRV